MSDLITRSERVAVLEKVAHDYLMGLQIALQDVKTQMAIFKQPDQTSYLRLQVKEQDLQMRIDDLKYKLKNIDAL